MTEEGIRQSLAESEDSGNGELRLTPSQNESRKENVQEPRSETVMAAPKTQRKTRNSRTGKKASSAFEDQMEERLRLNMESRFSSFEEIMLFVLADFSKQNKKQETADSRPRTVSSVTVSEGNTSGGCRNPISTASRTSRTVTLGTNVGLNHISGDNGLDDELFRTQANPLSVHSDSENEDMLSIQPGQQERQELMSQSGDSVLVADEANAERFSKYNANQNTSEESEGKKQNLMDLFGEDACIRKASSGTGILLDESQTSVLNASWRIKAPNELSSYKDSYRSSFPVNEKSEDMLRVPSLDDIIETFLIRRHSPKATFKKSRGLFTQHLKEIEKFAFQGQTAARMGIVIILYIQQALATLLSELGSENTNLDRATQTVRDVFAMSTKVLDQLGRTGAYDHYIRRKATMVDTGLDTVKDVAKHADLLPLTGDGVFGKEFETKLKDRKEKNKEYKDLVPEIGRRDYQSSLKRKAQSTNNNDNPKQRRFDNSRSGGNYNQNRSDYNPRYNNKSSGSSYSKFSGQQKKSYNGVSSFRPKSKKY